MAQKTAKHARQSAILSAIRQIIFGIMQYFGLLKSGTRCYLQLFFT